MQTFANGRLPTRHADSFDGDLIQELADKLTTLSRRAGKRGMRVDFEWLSEVLGERLARVVLHRAGFRRLPEQWAIGGGDMRVENYTYPPAFADKLEEIVDYYED